jgi:nitroreductase
MVVYDTAIIRRSIRRFKNLSVPKDVLEKCVNAARLAPSGANLQPLEYIVVDDAQLLPQIFSTIKWAAYIRPAGDPPPGHEPKAYIAILKDASAKAPWTAYDIGGAMENIILVALEDGVGSCALLNVDWDKLRAICSVSDSYEISLLIALGYPDESPVEEPFQGSVRYWKDENGVLHVPKKKLETILHWNAF